MRHAFTVSLAVLLAPLIVGCESGKGAVDSTAMAGHQHAGMSTPVTIPKGALYTEADVRFMQGMIAHHAQAIFMSKLAASKGANPRLLRFAMKIDQSQTAEIE